MVKIIPRNADFVAGLRVISVANPANPVEVGYSTSVGGANAVKVVGNHAYVANAGSGLAVLDVSNPASPTYIGVCSTTTYPRSVALADTFAYVADAQGGMHTISIAVPAEPRRLAVLPTGFAVHAAAAGGLVYLAADSRLTCLDMADPQSPQTVAFYDLPATTATPAGELCYVTTGTGISILRFGLSAVSEKPATAVSGQALRVSPNPARGAARLICPAGVRSAAVIDAAGRTVATLWPQGGTALVAGLEPGVYFLQAAGSGARPARLVIR
ncbi:MAG: hypothetical protein R6X13_01845 [bacterium]